MIARSSFAAGKHALRLSHKVTDRSKSRGWFAACLLALVALAISCGDGLAQAYTFSPSAVGSSQSQPITLTIKTAGILSSITGLTLGTPGLDFASSGVSCTAGTTYTAGSSCTVSVSFTPRYPGLRSGAVVLADASGNVLGMALLSGTGNGSLAVMASGDLTPVAGDTFNNAPLPSGTDATKNSINTPLAVVVDGAGNFFYTDSLNHAIRKVQPSGSYTTIAGTGIGGYTGDGAPAVNAELNQPSALALDGAGNLYVCDSLNNVIREIHASTGIITTVAGTGGAGYSGDGAAATAAELRNPQGISIDRNGNLLIADTDNNVIRQINATTGNITTIAGSATHGFTGDGGPASAATFYAPVGVYAAPDGTIYIADSANNVIRQINAGGIINTVAGSPAGAAGYTGDNGPATAATLSFPVAVTTDAAGDLLIADSQNNAVRKVNGTSGKISTFAGNGSFGYSGNDSDANASGVQFTKTGGIALDGVGNLFIADEKDSVIRLVSGTTGALHYPAVKETNPSPAEPQTLENDGNAALTITAITPVSNSAVDAGTTTCLLNQPLTVGSQCTIGAVFKPTSVSSPSTVPVQGSISIVSDSASTPETVLLSGISLSIFPTATTIAATPNPAAIGSAVTINAAITDTGGTFNTTPLSGTVTFFDNVSGSPVQIGTPQTVIGNGPGRGTAALTYTGFATTGNHPISATYSGDSGDATSSTATPNYSEVINQPTSTAVAVTPNPGTVFGTISFSATVTATNPFGAATTPGGTITFSFNGNPFPGQPINVTAGPGPGQATATFTNSTLAKGQYTITASYSGDTSNLPSNNSTTETIGLATATTSLTSSAASAQVTQPITFTATVNGVGGNTPSSNVVFTDTFNGATTTLGTVPVNPANSTAVLSNDTALAPGTHSVTATYQGDGTNYAASAPSNALAESITQVPTIVSLNPTNGTGIAGGTTTYSIIVTANSATNGPVALGGTVTLTTTGGTILGTGTLQSNNTSNPATATATIKVTNGGPGNVPVTASYGGATDYATSSTGGALLLTQATTTTSLSPASQTISATQTATVAATVTSVNGGTPTGNLTFTDTTTGTTFPAVHLDTRGNATLTVSTFTVGTHSIVATYQGDANNNPSAPSSPVAVNVNIVQPTMVLAPSANPTRNGQPFSLTASIVTGLGSDTASGTVTFTDSVASDPPQTGSLQNGRATFTSTTLTNGTHNFTVTYTGDANNSPTTKSLTVTVLQTATLIVTGNPTGPISARQPITFTATLTPLQGTPATGSITFLSNGIAIGTQPLINNTATLQTTSLPVGTDQITAAYTGDGYTQSITSNPYTQIVNADGVTLNINASSNPATFGAPLTLTATGSGTNGPLTGKVLFNDTFNGATTTVGSGTFLSGIATVTTTTLQPGMHSVVAAYQGDANDAAATSAPVTFSVKRQTNAVVTADTNPQLALAPVNLTATISNGSSTAFATGVVTFLDGTTQIGTGTLNAAGVATLAIPSLAVGSHSITVQYPGDALNLAGTSQPYAEAINLRQTTDELSTTASSLSGGQQLTLISVVHYSGPVVPTGTVVFYTGSAVLATQKLDGNGVATVTVLLTTPTAALTAVYSGDASYASSTSAVDNVTLTQAPNFNLTVNPGVITVAKNQHTTAMLAIASMKNFTDTLQLGCVGLPQAATCTFSQNSKTINSVVLPAGGAQTVSLTIDTGNPLQAGSQASLHTAGRPGTQASSTSTVLACILPGCFLLGLLGLRQRRFRNMAGLLMLLCLAGASAALSGCASLNINGTAPGTYTFRVTAVGQTGVSQATSVTLTVTQ